MTEFAWFCFAFFCGSLPFSVWLGRLFIRRDIRKVGDGNPGATNVMRAGGRTVGILAYLLDISKGAFPVGLAYQNFHVDGFWMVLVGLAPSFGHAFSPFLRGRGGKALAVSLGVWIGLTNFEVPIVCLSLIVLGYALLTVEGWAVVISLSGTGLYLLIFHPDPLLLAVLLGQIFLLVWKHRFDLQKPLALRPWVLKRLDRFSPH
jgi:glycerol-3-phosphate acyltransferase PlsY